MPLKKPSIGYFCRSAVPYVAATFSCCDGWRPSGNRYNVPRTLTVSDPDFQNGIAPDR
jgi:hypothetical protein